MLRARFVLDERTYKRITVLPTYVCSLIYGVNQLMRAPKSMHGYLVLQFDWCKKMHAANDISPF
jgi:hypothetical protein